jgi:hypothetical protein
VKVASEPPATLSVSRPASSARFQNASFMMSFPSGAPEESAAQTARGAPHNLTLSVVRSAAIGASTGVDWRSEI